MSTMLLLAAQAVDEGLTAQDVISSLPVDPLSIFALLLLAGAFVAVVYFGTRDWMAPEDAAGGRESKPVATPREHPAAPRGEEHRGRGKKAA